MENKPQKKEPVEIYTKTELGEVRKNMIVRYADAQNLLISLIDKLSLQIITLTDEFKSLESKHQTLKTENQVLEVKLKKNKKENEKK